MTTTDKTPARILHALAGATEVDGCMLGVTPHQGSSAPSEAETRPRIV